MDSKSKAVDIQDLYNALHSLDFWSHKGFQNFRDSGYLKDILEAVESQGFNYSITIKNLSEYVFERTTFTKNTNQMSGAQVVELLKTVPTNNLSVWYSFFRIVNFLGGSSLWFEENKLTWEMRDEWREKIGLERLNPVLKNSNDIEIVFRLTGHGNVWKNSPKGYRYATVREVSGLISLPNQNERTSAIFYDGKWRELKKTKLGNISWEEIFRNPEIFFHSNVLYIPLVKL